MLRTVRSLVLLLTCGLVAIACAPEKRPPTDTEVTGAYVFAIDSTLEIDMNGVKTVTEGRTEIAYRNALEGSTVRVSVDHVKARASVDGQVQVDSEMSAAGGRMLTAQGLREQPVEEASDEVKRTIRETFGVPLAEIEVDGDGRDLERRDVAGEAAQPLIQAGLIDNARFFHVPFPTEESWTAERRFGTGVGTKASGMLEYRKGAETDGRVLVEVSGSMTGTGSQSGRRMENVRYEVSGTQIYDRDLAAWVEGRLEVDVSYELWGAHSPVASATGTLEISLAPNGAVADVAAEDLPPVGASSTRAPEASGTPGPSGDQPDAAETDVPAASPPASDEPNPGASAGGAQG